MLSIFWAVPSTSENYNFKPRNGAAGATQAPLIIAPFNAVMAAYSEEAWSQALFLIKTYWDDLPTGGVAIVCTKIRQLVGGFNPFEKY